MKIVFIGTSEFALIILEKMIQSGYSPVLVVTAPDKPIGRKQIITPPPVKLLAKKYNINIIQPSDIRNFSSESTESKLAKFEIQNLKPDLGIVASFGKIIPLEILDIPKYGFINVHPSLLPKYRGPSPIQTAVLNGDQETGVTIIKMTEKIDNGPIILSEKLKSQKEKPTYQELHDELAELGANLLIKIIPDWLEGKIKPEEQDELKASYTKILKKEDGRMDWNKTAEALERQIRAFYPWPGSYAIWKQKIQGEKEKQTKIKILKTKILKISGEKQSPVGKVSIISQNQVSINCGKDYLLVEKLQMEGKKEMTAQNFLRGHIDFIGTILE